MKSLSYLYICFAIDSPVDRHFASYCRSDGHFATADVYLRTASSHQGAQMGDIGVTSALTSPDRPVPLLPLSPLAPLVAEVRILLLDQGAVPLWPSIF